MLAANGDCCEIELTALCRETDVSGCANLE